MVMCFLFIPLVTYICSLPVIKTFLLPHLNHLTSLPNPYVSHTGTMCLCISLMARSHTGHQVLKFAIFGRTNGPTFRLTYPV